MIPTKAELELSRWRERAACRGVDLAVFIPVAHHEASEAKAICSGCPVWKECALAAHAAKGRDWSRRAREAS